MGLGMGKQARDAAFSVFVEEQSPRLLRVAIGLTGSGDAARELLQDALVRTYGAWHRIRRDQAYAYTRTVMANRRIDVWRSTGREVPTDDLPDTASHPGTRTEDHDELARLLDRLPARQRAVVVLRYYEDLSEAEVARTLGISVGAVKSAASRGLATLRTTQDPIHPSEAGSR